jgi:hypothetical protein
MAIRGATAVLSALLLFAVSQPPAHAEPVTGTSMVYFDANGILVGHQIGWCQGNLSHAGNVYTPYHLSFEWDCTTRLPTGAEAFPGTHAVDGTLPPNSSIEQLCAQISRYCNGAPGPDILHTPGWTYSPGSGF